MQEYKRRSYIHADIDDVWSFYSCLDGLYEITPEWLGISVSRIKKPGEEWTNDFDTQEVLEEGTLMDMYLKPLGVYPVLKWRSEITVRERNESDAFFVDRAVSGPFEGQHHIHSFVEYKDGTMMQDTFVYPTMLPLPGILSKPVDKVVDRGFRYRHRRTREILE